MSYLDHFRLEQQPFRLTPDPEFVFWSKQHARAKAYMESTIWLADGFVVITGDIGSGKTTLLQSFLAELEDDVVYAVVSQTQLTATQFLQAVLTEFGFKPFKKRKVELLDMLNMFLIEQYSNGKKVLLIVDEAQNLSKRVLEEIRMLSGIETHKEKVLRIILAGQPELKQTLESPTLKQLVQRVRLRFHLGPLDRRETQSYIEHRLAVAGGAASEIMTNDCFDIIFKYTAGVPRLVNTLCDTAMLCAFAEDNKAVHGQDIMAAVNELGWKERSEKSGVYGPIKSIARPPSRSTHLTEIEIRSDGNTIAVQSFGPGRAIIGRSPDNEIFIKSKFVSRHHAQLVTDEKGSVVEDLNSTNGVFVGDKQIKKYRLRDGDIVSVGIHQLVYRDLRKAASPDGKGTRGEIGPADKEKADPGDRDGDEASAVRK